MEMRRISPSKRNSKSKSFDKSKSIDPDQSMDLAESRSLGQKKLCIIRKLSRIPAERIAVAGPSSRAVLRCCRINSKPLAVFRKSAGASFKNATKSLRLGSDICGDRRPSINLGKNIVDNKLINRKVDQGKIDKHLGGSKRRLVKWELEAQVQSISKHLMQNRFL